MDTGCDVIGILILILKCVKSHRLVHTSGLYMDIDMSLLAIWQEQVYKIIQVIHTVNHR